MTITLTPSTFGQKVLLVLLVTGIVAGGVYVVGGKIIKAQTAAIKAELAATKADFLKQTGAIDSKVTVLLNSVAEKDKQIATLNQEKAALAAKDAKDVADLNAAKEKLQTAPPETLVSEGQRILKTTEIHYVKPTATVEFSLAAYRNDVIALTEWESFKLKIIPDKDAMIANMFKTNAALTDENKSLKQVVALDTDWKKFALNTMDHYQNIALKSIAPGFWQQLWGEAKTSAVWGGLGFALGYLTGHKK